MPPPPMTTTTPTGTAPPAAASAEEVADLHRRVGELEAQVRQLKEHLAAAAAPPGDQSWRRMVGNFADDPAFEEIARLGREWRQSQRAEAAEQ